MRLHKTMLIRWFNGFQRLYQKNRTRSQHALVMLLIGVFYFYVVIPVFHIHIPCIFHSVTGFYLPGCGMTRCIRAIMAFDFYQAFRYNMLPFVLLPLAILYGISLWKNRSSQSARWVTTMLVITVVYGVLRNIDFFAWLGPTAIT